jgi:hypothetical protein
MGLLDRILTGQAKELTDSIGGILDETITTDKEKLEQKERISNLVLTKLTEVVSAQKEVLVTEMQGTKLQRNWRPILMLCFGFIVIYSKFIAVAFGLPNTLLEPQFWDLLSLGIGGYVVGRSVEKVADTVTKNIDISFIKKKNR